MIEPELTKTTIRYLFASDWAPPDDPSGWTMEVPGARVGAWDTVSNLLNLAIWNLPATGVIEIEQLRPYKPEKAGAGGLLGGKSFTRIGLLDPDARSAGLEGALLDAARELAKGGIGDLGRSIAKRLARDDRDAARGLVLAIDLDSHSPWNSVAGPCIAEAIHAGLLELKTGLTEPFPQPVITQPETVESLRERDAKIVTARRAYREAETELDNSVLADCLAAVYAAHAGTG